MKNYFNTIVSKFSQIPEGMGCKAGDARLLHRKGVEKKQNIDMTACVCHCPREGKYSGTVCCRLESQSLRDMVWTQRLKYSFFSHTPIAHHPRCAYTGSPWPKPREGSAPSSLTERPSRSLWRNTDIPCWRTGKERVRRACECHPVRTRTLSPPVSQVTPIKKLISLFLDWMISVLDQISISDL